MNSNEGNLFALQIRMLKFVGISLQQKDNIFYTIYSYIMLSGILSLSFFTTQATLMNLDNFDNLMENLVFDAAFLTAFVKITALLLTRRKIMKTLQILQNGIFVSTTERKYLKEDSIVEEGMLYINIEAIILCLMTTIFGLSANIEIINRRLSHGNSNNWRLPFGDFSALNVSYNVNFNIAWAYQSTFVWMGCLAYCSVDIFIIAIMAYLSFQCKVLQNLIKTSVTRSHAKMILDICQIYNKNADDIKLNTADIKWFYLQQALRELVQYHMSLIKITSEFENVFHYQTLINFIGFSFIICLALFYSTSMDSFNFRSLQQLTLACGATTLQLTMAYWGNEIIFQNLAIGEACAELDFTGTDIRFQKGLSLVIHRTQIPIRFTVGKFSPLTLRTFLTVMKATYSYYMFLHNFSK